MVNWPYTPSYAKIGTFFSQIQSVGKPEKTTETWLASIGLKSENDRRIVSVAKALGFVDSSGAPAERWQSYRNKSAARSVMAQAIRDAYSLLFQTYVDAHKESDDVLSNFFSAQSKLGSKTVVFVVRTFRALAELADFDAATSPVAPESTIAVSQTLTPMPERTIPDMGDSRGSATIPITMNIQIVIPSDASQEQYDMIFSSIKRFLTPHA